MDGSTAAAFHADASVKKLALHGQELKIGWGKASNVPPAIQMAVSGGNATRNVFVGNLPEAMNEQDLRNACSKFGPIDQVKIVRDKNIGFIHFLSISTAIKVSACERSEQASPAPLWDSGAKSAQVVQQLPSEPGWQERRVNYGKVSSRHRKSVEADNARRTAVPMSPKHNKPPFKLLKLKPQQPFPRNMLKCPLRHSDSHP